MGLEDYTSRIPGFVFGRLETLSNDTFRTEYNFNAPLPLTSFTKDYSFIPSIKPLGSTSYSTPVFNYGENSSSNYFSFGGRDYGVPEHLLQTYELPRPTFTPRFSTPHNYTVSTPSLATSRPSVASSRSQQGGKCSEYAKMSRSTALNKAQNDSRLESIASGGTGWSCSSADFRNDIMFATKGTTERLNRAIAKIRQTNPSFSLKVTSALGTSSSPHCQNGGHYSVDATKLDFGGGMSKAKAQETARLLMSTGEFAFANPECDGKTWHIDAKLKYA